MHRVEQWRIHPPLVAFVESLWVYRTLKHAERQLLHAGRQLLLPKGLNHRESPNDIIKVLGDENEGN